MLGAEGLVDFARLIEPPDALARLVEGEAHACVLVLVPARADAEIEPPLGDDVRRDGDLRQHGGMAVGVARHHQAEAEAVRCGGERAERLPSFEAGAIQMPIDRREMIEEPGMFERGNTIGLLPDAQNFLIGNVLRCGLEAKS